METVDTRRPGVHRTRQVPTGPCPATHPSRPLNFGTVGKGTSRRTGRPRSVETHLHVELPVTGRHTETCPVGRSSTESKGSSLFSQYWCPWIIRNKGADEEVPTTRPSG